MPEPLTGRYTTLRELLALFWEWRSIRHALLSVKAERRAERLSQHTEEASHGQ